MSGTFDPVKRWATEAPDAPAVVLSSAGLEGGAQRWSWAELDARVEAAASTLAGRGLGPGGRVGAALPLSPELVVLFHAVLRAGGVFVPIQLKWTESEIARGMAAIGPLTLLVSGVEEVAGWTATVEPDRLPGFVPTPRAPALDAPAAILLTSGSSGAPRPITLTHRNLLASARGAIERLDLRPGDCWFGTLSPGHVGGIALLHRAAIAGSAVFPRPRFDPEEAARLIRGGEVTHISLVPAMLDRLLKVAGETPPPPALRCLLLGGDHLPRELLDRALARGYPVSLTYGMTEASSQIATATPEEVRRKPGSVGKPLQGIEVRIASEGDHEAGAVSERESGEILVRGPTVVWGLPILNDRPARGASGSGDSPSTFLDPEEWLHTGDLGRIDADGDLHVLGRLTDRIITGGVTVEPAEVEEAIAAHPQVLEVAATGVPDAEWGERILIGVVPRDPASPPTLEELLTFARERLAPAKRPRELRILPELPRNERGKVVRSRLRNF